MNKPAALLLLTLAVSSFAAMSAWGDTVYYNGQVLTQDSRTIGGQVYVPLSDVARVLSGKVTPRPNGLEIVTGGASTGAVEHNTAPGGANEVRGTKGNVGDWFFNGLWRFRVSKVERLDTYPYKYYASAGSDTPSGPNDQLIVIDCTIKNGMATSDEPILSSHGLATQVTALTDDQGQSYAPIDFDSRNGSLIPGAAKNFAVVFSVPKGTNLTNFIFTIYSYGNSTKVTNVRVSMVGQ
jgi:hypothetical protein